MTVPLGQRSENKLQVIVNARELCRHTLACTANARVFLPEYKESLTNLIDTDARNIYLYCWRANKINIQKNGTRRLELQKEALWLCEELLALLMLAQQLMKFRAKKLEYFVKLIDKEEKLIKGWIEYGK